MDELFEVHMLNETGKQKAKDIAQASRSAPLLQD